MFCEICHLDFESDLALALHVTEFHSLNFKDIMGKPPSYYKLPLSQCDNIYVCRFCGGHYLTLDVLRTHERKQHNFDYCEAVFTSEYDEQEELLEIKTEIFEIEESKIQVEVMDDKPKARRMPPKRKKVSKYRRFTRPKNSKATRAKNLH